MRPASLDVNGSVSDLRLEEWMRKSSYGSSMVIKHYDLVSSCNLDHEEKASISILLLIALSILSSMIFHLPLS